MRKVLIGTPSHDGRLDVWYTNSLLNTIRATYEQDVDTYVHAIYTSYDSLVQRARNSLVKIALEQNYDYLFFIDSDVEWDPEWIFRFLDYPEDIVGAPLVKKSDEKEGYTCKILDRKLKYNQRGDLIEVDGVGTGFLKMSRRALVKLWNAADDYKNEETMNEWDKMIFDVVIRDNILISEDYTMCNKWKDMGEKVYMDPSITINHLGPKKFIGNFANFLTKNNYR